MKVTLGNFLKVCREPGFDPKKVAFMMATAHGPCRFGQYAPWVSQQLEELGYGDALVFSPTSADGYQSIRDGNEGAEHFTHSAWFAVVAGDIALKLLLKTRPYETNAGDSDAAFEQSVDEMSRVLEKPGIKPKERLAEMVDVITQSRNRFRAIPANYEKGRPMIGLVGEIFCRLNTFSNDHLARRVEQLGGECWMSDVAEWVWYVNWYVDDKTIRNDGKLSLARLAHKIKTVVQHKYERKMLAPLAEDFKGYEEPPMADVLTYAEPYLPPEGCIGEMAVSTGKAVDLYRKGADGIIDISPFTCMNGIISEAVYPTLSADHDDIPIRIFYFDGNQTNVDRDLEIFLDLARAYQQRKKHPRVYPDCFA